MVRRIRWYRLIGALMLALLPMSTFAGPDLPGGSPGVVELTDTGGWNIDLYAQGLDGAIVTSPRSMVLPHGSTVKIYKEGDISGCAEVRYTDDGIQVYPNGRAFGYPFGGTTSLCGQYLGIVDAQKANGGFTDITASW